MFSDKTYCLILLISFCSLAKAKLTKEEQLAAEVQCVEEVNIKYDIILESSRTQILSNDPKYKEFLHCYYTKQGLQSKEGEIQFNEISNVLQVDGGIINAEEVLRPCRLIRAPAKDMAFLVLQCIFSNILTDKNYSEN